ncbi:leucine-rich repeat domain-containing protein [Aquimarina aquimarini]|uniref:leucine-rich repeat domain-containing protein n=2 Tax=Aquimarina aquimarini TaxID=1191734 RepID=UPI001F3B5E95|nr:DUF5018 domain-containing protein [Aquimarina aquimarini]
MKITNLTFSRSALHTSLFILATLLFISCGNDDDGVVLSTEKQITTFSFLATDNEALNTDVKTTINLEAKTITAEVPFATDLTALQPTITISAAATVNPSSKKVQDFTKPVAYTVTAEDGSKQVYQIQINSATSDAKQITNVTFLATDHTSLDTDIVAVIDQNNHTITAQVPYGTDITALKPAITFSAGATITPNSMQAQDFTNPVAYTATANDGSTQVYQLHITTALNPAKEILSFSLQNANNPALSIDIESLLDQDNHTISILVPYGTDITALQPSITVLEGTTISPQSDQANDFTNPVTYTVTAQDGSTQQYQATVEYSDYPVLLEIIKQNNLLIWDVNDRSMESWIGISLNSTGRVIRILVGSKIYTIPAVIENLTELTNLTLYRGRLTSIPEQIGNLTKLTTLNFRANEITSIPTQIGNLTKLTTLDLGANRLTSIPTQIENLTQLTTLHLGKNQFTSIPTQISKLTKLTTLSLNFNTLTSIPVELGNLTELTKFYLNSNTLTSIPAQIGNLTKLTSLILSENPNLNTIPKKVCDLTTTHGTQITKDDGVTCI